MSCLGCSRSRWWSRVSFLFHVVALLPSSWACSSRCRADNTIIEDDSNNNNNNRVRIFYFVQVHNERTLHDALHLLRAIRDPRNQILIHVDVKAKHLIERETDESPSSDNPLQREIDQCPCHNTIRVESKFDVQWSHWSMNLPTLWALQVAVDEYVGLWDVWINLSGDTLPVYTVDVMADTLSQLPYSFVTSSSCETGLLPTNVYYFPTWWHKRRHYKRDESEKDPTLQYQDTSGNWHSQTLVTHFGSQWVVLQYDFCRWLVADQLQRPNSLANQFRDYLESSQKLMTDETFIPTLIMHVNEFRDTLPKTEESTGRLLWKNGTTSSISHIRFERMDEHVPTAFGVFPETQRYQVPESMVMKNQVEQPRPWGPYFLGTYDLGSIRSSGALFIRKVSERIDANLVRLFPIESASDIPPFEWPREVAITDKPDWDEKIRAVHAEMLQERDVEQVEEGHDGEL